MSPNPVFIPPAPNKPPLKGNCHYRVNNNNKKKRDKGNWSQTAFDWSQSRTITIAAAVERRVALLFLMELTGLRTVVNGL